MFKCILSPEKERSFKVYEAIVGELVKHFLLKRRLYKALAWNPAGSNVSNHSTLFFRFITFSLSLIIDRIFFGQVSKNKVKLKAIFNHLLL